MNVGHTKTFEALAVEAGKAVGLKRPTPAAVAADSGARERRDLLWAEYESMLRDSKTYRLEDLRAWLVKQGVRTSLSTVERNRRRVLDRERLLALASERTRQFLEAVKGTDESEVFAAARKRAGQMLFDFFLRLPTDALEELEPGQILKAFEVVGKLSKAHADVGLIEQKMREAHAAAAKAVEAKAAKAKDGRISREDVYEILDRVMKGEAA